MQLLTVRDLLHGKAVEMPAWGENRTYKAAAKVKAGKPQRTPSLPMPEGDDE